MKKITMSVLAIMLVLFTYATEQKTTSDITDVTVYLKGATVSATAKAQVPYGVSNIRITNQSQYIDANSIQVGGKGAFTILGVSYEVNYIEKLDQTQRITSLQNDKKVLSEAIEMLVAEKNVYVTEVSLLDKNMSLKGNETGLLVSELEKAANFYRSRLLELQKKQIDLTREIAKKQTKVNDIQNQLRALNATQSTPTGDIIVSIASQKAQAITLDLSYYIAHAGWSPIYDVRVQDVNAELELTYKANVFQNTGVSWDNVKLTLSTGNPSLGGTVPTLNQWILRKQHDYQATAVKKYTVAQKSKVRAMSFAVAEIEEEADYSRKAESASYNWAQVEQKTTTVEFLIDLNVTVGSGEKPAIVTVQEYKMPAHYIYKCIPKKDTDAFLIAKVGGYEQFNLLSGTANLFFQGAYVGESYIDTEDTSDSLQLSLGRDKGVIVTRTKIDDYTSKKVIGQKQKEKQGFEIAVKNNKQTAIDIVIVDQVPISGQDDIDVSDQTYDGGVIDEKTGLVEWKLQIPSTASKKAQITYLITYPKSWRINR